MHSLGYYNPEQDREGFTRLPSRRNFNSPAVRRTSFHFVCLFLVCVYGCTHTYIEREREREAHPTKNTHTNYCRVMCVRVYIYIYIYICIHIHTRFFGRASRGLESFYFLTYMPFTSCRHHRRDYQHRYHLVHHHNLRRHHHRSSS